MAKKMLRIVAMSLTSSGERSGSPFRYRARPGFTTDLAMSPTSCCIAAISLPERHGFETARLAMLVDDGDLGAELGDAAGQVLAQPLDLPNDTSLET